MLHMDQHNISGLIWVTLVMFTLAGCIVNQVKSESTSLHEQREKHQFKTLASKKYNRIAGLSDKKFFKKQILNPMLIERTPGSEGSLLTQEHIKFWMAERLGWTIEEDPFTDETPFGLKRFVNIIAKLDPNANRFLTLVCHFDSKYFEQFEFIGATDSAVPCSILIDIARTLNYSLHESSKSSTSGLSLQFLFLDGEEAFVDWTETDSLYGSRHLAKKWIETPHSHHPESNALDSMDAFVLLDLIGAKGPKFRKMFSETEKLFDRLIAIEAKLHKLESLESHLSTNEYFMKEPFHGRVEDDHVPFLQKGVPILHLISVPFPSVWHTRDDNESALHYPTIDNLNKILRIFVFEYLHLNL